MKCVLVYKEDFPWDVRVEKLAHTFRDMGHSVTVVAKNRGQNEVQETLDGIRVQRLPKTHRLPTIIGKLVNIAIWFNPFWIWSIAKALRGGSEEKLVVVRDIPLIGAAFLVSKFIKATVILDMAECYPEMYASTALFRKRSIGERILKSPSLARAYESLAIRYANHTFVMIEESLNRIIKRGASPERVTIVSNTPRMEWVRTDEKKHSGPEIRIVYIGFLTRIRGIDLMIRGIRKALDIEPDCSIQFDVIGVGIAEPEISKLRNELDLNFNVRVHGWLDHDDVARLVRTSNVGALTYRVCGHWNHTIPNKIFDYMAAGLPIIATEVTPIRRIIEETRCGLVSADQDIDGIARSLLKLRSPELRQQLGENGRTAVLQKYNWAVDQRRLEQAIVKTMGMNF